jgi:hypothetical protein
MRWAKLQRKGDASDPSGLHLSPQRLLPRLSAFVAVGERPSTDHDTRRNPNGVIPLKSMPIDTTVYQFDP